MDRFGFFGQLEQSFGFWNWLVFLAYLFVMAGIGWWTRWRAAEGRDRGFFDAGGKIPWWVAGLSIYATHQSSVTCMAVPARVYSTNWAIFLGYLTIPPAAILSAYLFATAYRNSGVLTCYEYLESKFGKGIRKAVACLFILVHLGKIGIFLLLPAQALSVVTSVNPFVSILLVGIVVTVYSSLGGMRSVVWTDLLQVFLMTGGAIACIAWIASQCGGVGELLRVGMVNEKFGIFSSHKWDQSSAWIILIGGFIVSMYSFSSEQSIVQRYFVTKDLKETIRSCWLNGLFLIPAVMLFFFLGTSLWVFSQDFEMTQNSKVIVPWFVVQYLPGGLAGLGIAGLMAASMSSLDSSINSIAAVVYNDFMKAKTDNQGGKIGTQMSVLLGVMAILSAVTVEVFSVSDVFSSFIGILSCFAGVIFSVFLLSLFVVKRSPAPAAVCLVCGFLGNGIAFFVFNVGTNLYELAIVGFFSGLVPGMICLLLTTENKLTASDG